MKLDEITFTNSKLISGTLYSPNYTSGYYIKSGITPHYMDGLLTAKQCAEIFYPRTRMASSNYTIGYDGEIWLVVNEWHRSWCTGSRYNDEKRVTIECANYKDSSLPTATWDSLIKLCADICKRNGFRLNYTGDDNGNLTKHMWYQNTDCPGAWLSNRFGELAQEVNKLLDNDTESGTNIFGGMYKCMVDVLNVRDKPSLNGHVVAIYQRGETVVLDDYYTIADGYVWGRYTGLTSGQYRYVAIGPNTGKVEKTDYLIKI